MAATAPEQLVKDLLDMYLDIYYGFKKSNKDD
jgi:hypothetical protein